MDFCEDMEGEERLDINSRRMGEDADLSGIAFGRSYSSASLVILATLAYSFLYFLNFLDAPFFASSLEQSKALFECGEGKVH